MFFGAKVERDPQIQQLTQNVQQQLSDILNELEPKEERVEQNAVRFVSFEDALKELAALKNS
jgi:hypothetical protein